MTNHAPARPLSLMLVTLLALAACKPDAKGRPPKAGSGAGSTTGNATTNKAAKTAPHGSTPRLPPAPKDHRGLPAAGNHNSLLGGERGFDHVGIALSKLEDAGKAYVDKLGFGNPQPGRLPNGIENINFYFGDSTYLELLTPYDKTKAKGVARFVAAHQQGAMFFVLAVFSYGQTSAFLRRRGRPVGRPFPGRIKSPGVSGKRTMWHTFFLKKPLPGDPLFFITYRRSLRRFLLRKLADPKIRATSFSHPNTALGLHAAWIVSKDLAAAKKTYAAIGLPSGAKVALPALDAAGVEVEAGSGRLLLLSPKTQKQGPTAAFLKARGDGGILGLTIVVGDLKKARAVIEKGLGRPLKLQRGVFGESFFVPPRDAYGVWLEFAQHR